MLKVCAARATQHKQSVCVCVGVGVGVCVFMYREHIVAALLVLLPSAITITLTESCEMF